MFVKCIRDDLGLGDGEGLTLIIDMQKGLYAASEEVLPLCVHRKCARHFLAHWAKDWRGFQRRQQFWKIAKNTFEAQLRNNIQKMKLFGPKKMIDDLMYYNLDYWCKVYFNTKVKCDSVDNNMAECINTWILAAGHKTTITMLKEIRVKMMTRIANLREFSNTWKCNGVLEENITKSMSCTIEFNGAVGFEVRGSFSMQNNFYSKETYLRTYATVLEPLTNMEMWPVSTNSFVLPPEITNMPGMLSKARRKEAGETKKSRKQPRTGLAMTCSICHTRGHNKRGCPSAPTPPQSAPTAAEPTGSDKRKGRPKKTPAAPTTAPSASVPPEGSTGSVKGRVSVASGPVPAPPDWYRH